MNKLTPIAIAFLLAAVPALAQECSSAVQSAQQNAQQAYVSGMSGLITNNFSSRPSSFGSMACLDKFMQGSQDIMFKPPSLTSLLGTVMNFACQQAATSTSGSSSAMPNIGQLLGSLSGGLNLSGLTSSTGSAVNLSGLLGAQTGNTVQGGLSGMYTVRSQ